jgi:hypothetical protein
MRRPHTKRKCKHCQTFFEPDPRSAKRQHHCSKPACRQASKAASQHRWLQKPGNRDYFTGPTHVERVRQWRKAHPGYWRRRGVRTQHTLQEDLMRFCRNFAREVVKGQLPLSVEGLRRPGSRTVRPQCGPRCPLRLSVVVS